MSLNRCRELSIDIHPKPNTEMLLAVALTQYKFDSELCIYVHLPHEQVLVCQAHHMYYYHHIGPGKQACLSVEAQWRASDGLQGRPRSKVRGSVEALQHYQLVIHLRPRTCKMLIEAAGFGRENKPAE